jgi:hypothetical protein
MELMELMEALEALEAMLNREERRNQNPRCGLS